jgi:hypothetical protein
MNSLITKNPSTPRRRVPRSGRPRPRLPHPRLLGLAAVAVAVLAAAATCGSGGGTGAFRTVPISGLTPHTSPDGDYTVGVPAGWTAQPLAAGTDYLRLTPANGPAQTSIVFIPGLAISDSGYAAMELNCASQYSASTFGADPDCTEQALMTQEQDSSQPWTPQRALAAIVAGVNQSASFGAPQITSLSPHAATFEDQGTVSGQAVSTQGFIEVVPVANPLLDSGQGWTSEAILGYCAAPAGQARQLQTLCPQVLGSFRTGPTFWSNVIQGLASKYAQEEQDAENLGQTDVAGFAASSQLISQWGTSVQQLQAQSFESIQARDLDTGQHAIAALGGDTLEGDPGSGTVYSLPYGYGGYCVDATGTTAILGAGVTPGVDGCNTVLHNS